jgi:hypothetical protein
MLNILLTCGQVLSLVGVAYGAYLAIKHRDVLSASVRDQAGE